MLLSRAPVMRKCGTNRSLKYIPSSNCTETLACNLVTLPLTAGPFVVAWEARAVALYLNTGNKV